MLYLTMAWNKKGQAHWNWKGGKKNNHGYIMIYQPKHPYCDQQGYVREHRLVVEKIINRYLLPNEVVHHVNGNKADNRPENLRLMAKSEHDTQNALGAGNNFWGRKHTNETKQKISIKKKQQMENYIRGIDGKIKGYAK